MLERCLRDQVRALWQHGFDGYMRYGMSDLHAGPKGFLILYQQLSLSTRCARLAVGSCSERLNKSLACTFVVHRARTELAQSVRQSAQLAPW